MLEVLSDGAPHTKRELHSCLRDELAPLRNIAVHLTALNKKLRRHEQEIVCISGQLSGVRYMWVRQVLYGE